MLWLALYWLRLRPGSRDGKGNGFYQLPLPDLVLTWPGGFGG
jgi:hypothetical protein